MMSVKLFNDNFQNFKAYNIPKKAQLLIADIPYNIGSNAYSSCPLYWKGKDYRQGHSDKAGKNFFRSDSNFNIAEFFHFAAKMLIAEPKDLNKAPAMIVFCAWQQIPMVVQYGEKHGFKKSYPLYFVKNNSPQALKANMKILGAVETALVLYRDKLPKFNNDGNMILNWFPWHADGKNVPRVHPTQKPVNLLKTLIRIFTDQGDTVIDPVAGSGSTLRACLELDRHAYGFEIDKNFYRDAIDKMLVNFQPELF